MGTPVVGAEFDEHLRDYNHTAFRLELQPVYLVDYEQETFAKFLAGTPESPIDAGFGGEWYEQVAAQTSEGKRMERVRVHDDPPTDYQRWERWIDQWNRAAGEIMRYLTRKRAHEIGLLPAAGNVDWWLFDSNRLMTMHFDERGRRIRTELVTDPATVVQACAWRDLAVHYSELADDRAAVA